jgi:acetone carboxylase gamma subunit
VVIDGDAIDDAATTELRSGLIDARKANGGGAPEQAEGEVALNLGPSLALYDRSDGFDVGCRACGASLGPLSGWKERAVHVVTPASEVNPHITEAANFVDDAVIFRHFCCPGCGVALDGEVAVGDDGPFDDIALEPSAS